MEQLKRDSGNNYRRLASDIIVFIVGTVLAKAIQFFLLPLYTTYMTAEAYGVAELTNNLSELFFPMATLCIYEAAFRFAADPDFDNHRLVVAVSKVMTGSFCVGFLIMTICKYVLKYQYAFYLFFILYAYSIRMCMAYFIRGCGYSKIFAMSGIVNALTLCGFNYIFLVKFNATVQGYLMAIGLSYCCSAAYLFVRGQVFRSFSGGKNSRDDLKVLFKYCLPLIFYNILYWFVTISGRYVLMWFSDSSTAGKYIAAIKIAAIINMIQQAVYAAFQLDSTRVFKDDNKESYYSEITNVFISTYCAFGTVIICLTPIIARVTLKKEFFDAVIYLPIIMFAALMNCISSVLGTMYSTYKKTYRMVTIGVIGAAINFLLGIILTPQLGIWGVCIASVCCYFSQMIYKAVDIRKFCRIKYNWKIVVTDIIILSVQVIIMSIKVENFMLLSVVLAVLLWLINARYLIHAIKQMICGNN